MAKTIQTDALVIGAGAAGLMAAIQLGKHGVTTHLIDHANKPGKKILMSGGGRCNFTNYYVEPARYLSNNEHFCKSALSRYTQWDFIAMVDQHGIAYHEKTLGQLFCDGKAKAILEMLLTELDDAGVPLQLETEVLSVERVEKLYHVRTSRSSFRAKHLVIATGGLSIPTMGATGIGYQLAEQFGHRLLERRAGLVPFIFTDHHKAVFSELSGTSLRVSVSCNQQSFDEDMLFTHRGLSGPSMLQISSYWREGDSIEIDLLPNVDATEWLLEQKRTAPKLGFVKVLSQHWPKSVAEALARLFELSGVLGETSDRQLIALGEKLNAWRLKPSGTEGYRTAEVTLGGVDTDELSSKTMESKHQANLYFIGEVVDVTGHLGGFNFQWAWASGYVAAQAISEQLRNTPD